MRKSSWLCLFILLSGWFLLKAEVQVTGFKINQQQVLTSDQFQGKTGIVVTIENLTVKGYKGRKIYALARLLKDQTPPFVEKQIALVPDSATAAFKQLHYEFPYFELKATLGAGSYPVYVQFFLYTLSASLPEVLDNFYIVRTLELDLTEMTDQDPFDAVRERNRVIISKRAQTDKTFAAVRDLVIRLGIDFYVQDYSLSLSAQQDYSISLATQPDDPILAACLGSLVTLLESLPVSFVKTTGLKGVAFVNEISFYDNQVGGGLDLFRQTILCTLQGDGTTDLHWLQHIFCHEYFHYIDKTFYMHFSSTGWQQLNPGGFKYSTGGAMDYVQGKRENAMEEYPTRGFVTRYATADHYQDRAETFAYLMLPEYRQKLKGWIQQDTVLQAKVEFLITGLQQVDAEMHKFFTDAGLLR